MYLAIISFSFLLLSFATHKTFIFVRFAPSDPYKINTMPTIFDNLQIIFLDLSIVIAFISFLLPAQEIKKPAGLLGLFSRIPRAHAFRPWYLTLMYGTLFLLFFGLTRLIGHDADMEWERQDAKDAKFLMLRREHSLASWEQAWSALSTEYIYLAFLFFVLLIFIIIIVFAFYYRNKMNDKFRKITEEMNNNDIYLIRVLNYLRICIDLNQEKFTYAAAKARLIERDVALKEKFCDLSTA